MPAPDHVLSHISRRLVLLFDDVQKDIRELRTLVVGALKRPVVAE